MQATQATQATQQPQKARGSIKPNDWSRTAADVLSIPERAYVAQLTAANGNSYETTVVDIVAQLTDDPIDTSTNERVRTGYPVRFNGRTFQVNVDGGPVEVEFGDKVKLIALRGGPTSTGGWFAASSIQTAAPSK